MCIEDIAKYVERTYYINKDWHFKYKVSSMIKLFIVKCFRKISYDKTISSLTEEEAIILSFFDENDQIKLPSGGTLHHFVKYRLGEKGINDVMMLIGEKILELSSERFDQPVNWYNAYKETLENIGWIFTDDLNFQEIPHAEKAENDENEMYEFMLYASKSIYSNQDIAFVRKYVDSLNKLTSDPNKTNYVNADALKIWTKNSSNKGSGDLINGFCKIALASLSGPDNSNLDICKSLSDSSIQLNPEICNTLIDQEIATLRFSFILSHQYY